MSIALGCMRCLNFTPAQNPKLNRSFASTKKACNLSLTAERHCPWQPTAQSRMTMSTYATAPPICSWRSSPRGGQRIVSVTERRGKIDFVAFIKELLTGAYAKARRIHLVLDNLNTHFRKCFDDVLGSRAATKLLHRVEFHYTPKHASWLNMAEIEIGILSRQCLDRRIANLELLESEVAAWQQVRNEEKRTIEWNFTRQDADKKLGRHYVSKLSC